MTSIRPEQNLRPVTAALGVLKTYGGTPPGALTEAREAIRAASHLAAENRVADPMALAREVVSSGDMAATLARVSKTRATEQARAEVASALYAAAVERAVSVFAEHADEIADAVLSSEVLTSAFEEVERTAADVPASALAEPRADDVDLVARVALARRAVLPFERVLVSLVASGLVSEYDLPGAAHLLYADPTEADPEAARRALKGLRKGVPDVNVYTFSATVAPHAAPVAAPGVPAALLAATPGVVFRQCLTVEDFEARVRHVERASAPVLDEDDVRPAGLVL